MNTGIGDQRTQPYRSSCVLLPDEYVKAPLRTTRERQSAARNGPQIMPIQRAVSTAALAVLMSAAVANAASARLANFPSQRAETAAFAASAKGDNWIATNLFEQA